MIDARTHAAVLAERWLDARLETRCHHGVERAVGHLCVDCVTALAEQAYAAGAAAHVEHSRCQRCYDAGKRDASHLA